MGQTVFWPKIGPITTDFDETRGDLIPPMRPRIWSGSRARGGPKIEFLSWGGGGPMYAIVYPVHAVLQFVPPIGPRKVLHQNAPPGHEQFSANLPPLG